MLRTLGNIIWFLCGGIVMGLAWWLVGVLAFISIIGIPWGRACFVIGNFSFWPFGYEAISRDELTDQTDIGTSGFGVLGNIIWFILAGFLVGGGAYFVCGGLFYHHHRHSVCPAAFKAGGDFIGADW